MADDEHLKIIRKGVEAWNGWRRERPDVQPNLSRADLSGTYLSQANLKGANLIATNFVDASLSAADLSDTDLIGANLSRTNLNGANLSGAELRLVTLTHAFLGKTDLSGKNLSEVNLMEADLSQANLSGANLNQALLIGANLSMANLSHADLSNANLTRAYFSGANLRDAILAGANLTEAYLNHSCLNGATLAGANLMGAYVHLSDMTSVDLSGADLTCARIIEVDLKKANVSGCHVYGLSAWDINLEATTQSHLIINQAHEPTITVDDLELAPLIYLLLNNKKVRNLIDTVTSKAVLILGRFSVERKEVLDCIREELRKHNYVPIIFDFERPCNKDLQDTITILAGLVRFIIADLTEPRSIPQELVSIVPVHPRVPVMPLIKRGHEPWAMFDFIRSYPWVLDTYEYDDVVDLLATLKEKVITPAERKFEEQLRNMPMRRKDTQSESATTNK